MQPGGAARARSWEMNQLMGETSPLLLLHQKQLDDALWSGQSVYGPGRPGWAGRWPGGRPAREMNAAARLNLVAVPVRQKQFRNAGSNRPSG